MGVLILERKKNKLSNSKTWACLTLKKLNLLLWKLLIKFRLRGRVKDALFLLYVYICYVSCNFRMSSMILYGSEKFFFLKPAYLFFFSIEGKLEEKTQQTTKNEKKMK